MSLVFISKVAEPPTSQGIPLPFPHNVKLFCISSNRLAGVAIAAINIESTITSATAIIISVFLRSFNRCSLPPMITRKSAFSVGSVLAFFTPRLPILISRCAGSLAAFSVKISLLFFGDIGISSTSKPTSLFFFGSGRGRIGRRTLFAFNSSFSRGFCAFILSTFLR